MFSGVWIFLLLENAVQTSVGCLKHENTCHMITAANQKHPGTPDRCFPTNLQLSYQNLERTFEASQQHKKNKTIGSDFLDPVSVFESV